LGGSQYVLIGNLIEQQFLRVGDWRFGSAIAVVLMVLVLLSMALFALVDREKGDEKDNMILET
jgi:spermidine/putrescine transport system permease protein